MNKPVEYVEKVLEFLGRLLMAAVWLTFAVLYMIAYILILPTLAVGWAVDKIKPG